MSTVLAPAPSSTTRGGADRTVVRLTGLLALLAVLGSTAGLLVTGGPGRQEVTTTRGAVVTLFGDGLYSADTWLIGAGNRAQDVSILLFEVPVLIAALRWYRRGGRVAAAALTGVLAFFTYFYSSTVFATAQNRLFPAYVAAAAAAGFALVRVAAGLDVPAVARSLPPRPGTGALVGYLTAVAAALALAWLPEMLGTAVTGDVAAAVGPYTSAVTEALDLGVVVPVALVAAWQLARRRPLGRVLAFVMLVVNVCVGVLLIAQGLGQLLSGVPLTVAEIVAKGLTFATLTLVAGGMLGRMATTTRRAARASSPAGGTRGDATAP